MCRLKLSIIDTEFNYLIVSPEVHACVSYLRETTTAPYLAAGPPAPTASIKRKLRLWETVVCDPNIEIHRRLNLISNDSNKTVDIMCGIS